MKKIIFIFLIVSSFLWEGCNKDTFNYKMYTPTLDEIDSVYFSTGAEMLIADGQATLNFIVEAFRCVKMTNDDGILVDSMVAVDIASLPDGSVKIYKGSEEIGESFSTTDASPGTLTFVAKVGECTSQSKMVILRQKPDLPPLKYVDVIFHVFELKESDPSYNPLTNQELDYDLLVEAVQNMNDVFNNKIGKGPNGASANIIFRLATKNANGNELQNPGYNRIDYDENNVEPSQWGGFEVSSFINYMDESSSRIWDPEKYLNIVVMPCGANMSMGVNSPQWQVVAEGEEPIEGIANIVPDFTIPERTYANTCCGVPQTLFRPGTGRKIELYPFVGTFYGLRGTNRTAGSTDYCTDTQLYDGTGQYNNLKKVGLNGEKFLANNAMDDNRYPSLRNNFTLDQVTRMRQVMANCPGRNNGLDE